MSDDLPPLPQYDYGDYDFDEDRFIEAYTAEKMREYAKKAVEAEREACALKCEELGADWIHGLRVREQACADAIRARGDT